MLQEPHAQKLPANREHAKPTDWFEARQRLEQGRIYFLATNHPSGAPHVRPVLALWLDSALYFVANADSRKARNLALDSASSMTVYVRDACLVVEGTSEVVRDEASLRKVADSYASKYDWPVRIVDGTFEAEYGAPTAGPPKFNVYALRPVRAYGFGDNESWSPTRWRW